MHLPPSSPWDVSLCVSSWLEWLQRRSVLVDCHRRFDPFLPPPPLFPLPHPPAARFTRARSDGTAGSGVREFCLQAVLLRYRAVR